jgi:hypothetical protein
LKNHIGAIWYFIHHYNVLIAVQTFLWSLPKIDR